MWKETRVIALFGHYFPTLLSTALFSLAAIKLGDVMRRTVEKHTENRNKKVYVGVLSGLMLLSLVIPWKATNNPYSEGTVTLYSYQSMLSVLCIVLVGIMIIGLIKNFYKLTICLAAVAAILSMIEGVMWFKSYTTLLLFYNLNDLLMMVKYSGPVVLIIATISAMCYCLYQLRSIHE